MKERLISEFVVEACEAASDPNQTPYDLSMVCEISDRLLHILHPEIEIHDVLPCPASVELKYTELSQKLFDNYLNEVECALEDIGLTYELPSCTWVVRGEDT